MAHAKVQGFLTPYLSPMIDLVFFQTLSTWNSNPAPTTRAGGACYKGIPVRPGKHPSPRGERHGRPITESQLAVPACRPVFYGCGESYNQKALRNEVSANAPIAHSFRKAEKLLP